MTTPATLADTRTPLEAALADVQTTLSELLVAADEQYAALVERDRERLESVTRTQERLWARLAHAETRRVKALNGTVLSDAVAGHAETRTLSAAIASKVLLLKDKHAQTASLLQQSIELTDQTLRFLHRLADAQQPSVYGARATAAGPLSVLVDSCA